MPAIKLCIIGGGSHYTHHMLKTLADYVATGDLAGSTICLYDINQETARLMSDFGNSVARSKKLDFRMEAECFLEKALEGCDFVFSSIRVGGLDQLALDEELPLKYGLLGQETTGVSGVFMLCRQAPAIIEYAKAIEKICPHAIVINYSNPSGMVTELTQRVTKLNCLGLCDGVYTVKWLMCILMGLPRSEARNIEAYVAGVNHCTWTLGLRYQGQDLYPQVGELFEKMHWKDEKFNWHQQLDQCYHIYRHYGLLPGSTSYINYHLYVKRFMAECEKPEHYRASIDLREETRRIYSYVRDQVGKADANFVDAGGESAHGDQAMGALYKMACDTGDLEIVNVRNNGGISNLPDDTVVEVPALMNRQGAFSLSMGPLPRSVVGHVYATAVHYSLAVDAALSGDKKKVMQAAMAFPSNVDIDLMERCVEELFEQNKKWLPQFKHEGT
ncbi:MAG: hypothetical protein WC975_04430 [Phycisphaerae bacterium]